MKEDLLSEHFELDEDYSECDEDMDDECEEDQDSMKDYVQQKSHSVVSMSDQMSFFENQTKQLDWNSAHRSFFADSPYYNAFVEKEMRTIEIATDKVYDIGTKFTGYAKAGLLFAKATKRLSSACKLQSSSVRNHEKDVNVELQREALGPEVTETLESVGVILEKLANAQIELHAMIEDSIGAPLCHGSKNERETAKMLRKQAEIQTINSELSFSKYLHGKEAGGIFNNPNTNTGIVSDSKGESAADCSFWCRGRRADSSANATTRKFWTGATNFFTSSNDLTKNNNSEDVTPGAIFSEEEETEKLYLIQLAKWKHSLQKIREKQALAELKRFRVFKSMVDAKHKRNCYISEYLGQFCSRLQEHGNKYSDIIEEQIKKINKCQKKCEKVLSNHNKNDQPVWDQREKLLLETLNKMKKDEQASDLTVKHLLNDSISAKSMQYHIKGGKRGCKKDVEETLSIEQIEENVVKIWDLPVELATSSRYLREAPNKVILEGWLYEQNSGMMSLQLAWTRRWFIVRSDGIYCIQNNPQYKFNRNNEEPFVKVKICDIVLCTVREITYSSNINADTNTNKNINTNTNRNTNATRQVERFCFELIITPNQQKRRRNKPMLLQAIGPKECERWVEGIRSAVADALAKGDLNTNELDKNIGEASRASEMGETVLSRGLSVFLLEESNSSNGNMSSKVKFRNLNESTSNSITPLSQDMDRESCAEGELGSFDDCYIDIILAANPTCADCGQANPDWVSLNLGILVCLQCSGIHRSLGVHVSKVRSLRLDSLSDAETALLIALGNERMNGIWGGCVSLDPLQGETIQKPSKSCDRATRETWIKGKYVEKKYLCNVTLSNDDDDNFNNDTNDKMNNENESDRDANDNIEEDDNIIEDKLSIELLEAAKEDDVIRMARLIAHGANVDYKMIRNKEESVSSSSSLLSSLSSSSLSSSSLSSSSSFLLSEDGEQNIDRINNNNNNTTKNNTKNKKKISINKFLRHEGHNDNNHNDKSALEISILRVEHDYTGAVVCAQLLLHNGAHVDDDLLNEAPKACTLLSLKNNRNVK